MGLKLRCVRMGPPVEFILQTDGGGGTVGGKYEDREYSTEVIYSRTLGKTKIRWERNKREDGCQLTPTSGGESWESRR